MKFGVRGPDVARLPYVAPSCSRGAHSPKLETADLNNIIFEFLDCIGDENNCIWFKWTNVEEYNSTYP